MNSKRGFISMVCFCFSHLSLSLSTFQSTHVPQPPVNLGLHFDGIGSLPRLKLRPQIARKMLLEAHRWTGEEALADGIVDVIAPPDEMLEAAMELASKWAPKARMGVYGVLRHELWGEAAEKMQRVSYVHSRVTSRKALAKL